jgi:hypothetical protein
LTTRLHHGGRPVSDDFIVTAYVIVGETLAALGHRDDMRARVGDAGVLTVAVVAAKYFQDHLARPWLSLWKVSLLYDPLADQALPGSGLIAPPTVARPRRAQATLSRISPATDHGGAG